MNTLHVSLVVLLAGGFLLSVRILAKRGLLSLRYAMGWFLIGLIFLVLSPLVGIANWLGDLVGVQPLALLLGIPLLVLVVVCVQLSISVSGLTERVRTLAEEVAFNGRNSEEGHRDGNGDSDLMG